MWPGEPDLHPFPLTPLSNPGRPPGTSPGAGSACLNLKFVAAASFGKLRLMNETEGEILRNLVKLEDLVRSMSTADPKPNLLPLFDRIEQLTRELPPGTDPSLLHYLHKKSYGKARLFLQDRDAENARGGCDGRTG